MIHALPLQRPGHSVRLLCLVTCLASGCVASEKSRYVRHLTYLISPSEVEGESLVVVMDEAGADGPGALH